MTFVGDTFLVSNSEIQTFKDCPRRWWLAWHRGLKPRYPRYADPRSTGTRLHVALAAYYTPGGTADAAQRTLVTAHAEDTLTVSKFDPRDDQEHFEWSEDVFKLHSVFDLERAMLDGYLEWIAEEGVDADIEITAAESYVESPIFNIGGVKVRYIAKLDAKFRYLSNGRRGFIDHKTVGTLQDATLGINQQMLHYHLLDSLQEGDPLARATGALYNMLRKVKRTDRARPPFYARIPIDHNHHEVANYKLQLDAVVAQVIQASLHAMIGPDRASRTIPSRPSPDCSWKCPFLKICRMFDDGSRVEDAVRDLYVIGDPLDYYGDRIEGAA